VRRGARIAGGVALWLGALIVGFYFSTGSNGDTDGETPPELAGGIVTTTTVPAVVTTPTAPPPIATTTTLVVTPPATAPPTVTTTTAPLGDTAAVVASLDNGVFSLSGVVPDEAMAQRLAAAAGIVYGPNTANNLVIAPDVAAPPWLEGAPRAITLLPIIGAGSMTIDDTGAEVTGTAPNEPALAAFQQGVAAALSGAQVTTHVTVTNLGFPRFNARRIGDTLVLSGELASEAAKTNIVNGAIAVYGQETVDDQLTIGTELDTPFWTYTMPGVFQLLAPFPDYEINIENGVTGGALNAGANFENGSSQLKPETQALLAVAVAILTRDPSLGMEIAGHTDSNGSDEFNQTLSEARSQSAADFLVTAGIAAERLRPVGYGETRPIASNDTNEGRQANRRVEFRFGPLAQILGG